MTHLEFDDVGAYAAKLWPGFSLNPEQTSEWMSCLRKYNAQQVKIAMSSLYRESRYGLKLPELLSILRITHASKDGDDTAKQRRQAEDQQAMDNHATARAALAHWTDDDFERSKKYCLDREPALAVYENLPARGTWWTHILYTRFCLGVVTIFPPGHDPQEIPVEEWWRICFKGKPGPLTKALAGEAA